MKYLSLLIICLSFSAFSQDVIMKKDGKKIEAKVVEITTTMIKYRSWTQQDGPIRNVPIRDVKEVIYDDGTWDNFEDYTPVEEPEVEKEEPVRPPGPPRPSRHREKEVIEGPEGDPIVKSGFFIELMPGYARSPRTSQTTFTQYNPNTGLYEEVTMTSKETREFGSLSFRLGNKWYFGAREKWRPGIQATWLRLGIYLDDDVAGLFINPKTFSLANVGMTNVFKFTDKLGMEANITGGYNLEIDPDYGYITSGIGVTPEVKLRIGKLAVGIDYMHVFGFDGPQFPADWDVFSLSVGLKL